jgi:hypothetical protein
MAKVSKLSLDSPKAQTIPVVQLKDDLVINRSVYDLTNLYPRPFKNMTFGSNQASAGRYITGTTDFMLHTQSAQYGVASACYSLRGKRSGLHAYGASFMVDVDDSAVGWYVLPDGDPDSGTLYIYKINLTTKEIISTTKLAYGTYGSQILSQDSTNLYITVINNSSSYAYVTPVAFNKSDSSVDVGGNSGYRYSIPTYFTEDSSYVWFLDSGAYTTPATHYHQYDKSGGSWAQGILETTDDASRDNQAIPSQTRAVNADTDACYTVWPTTNTSNVYEIYKFQCVKSTQTLSSTQCTLDFTTTSGVSRSGDLIPFTNTGSAYTNTESWLTTVSGSDDHMCFTISEHSLYATEDSSAFKIYIFKIESTDTNLTYLGSVDPAVRIRNIMPFESDWTKIGVVYDGGIKFYSWNSSTTTYDYVDTFAASMVSVMQDQSERIWVLDDSNQLHMFSATTPVRITVTMDSATYNYTGSTINTHADVSAWDTAGDRVAIDVRLVLEGSAEFTDTSQSKTITTSASADTQVNINITGSSYSRVVANVVV